jgi:hypothetical protein
MRWRSLHAVVPSSCGACIVPLCVRPSAFLSVHLSNRLSVFLSACVRRHPPDYLATHLFELCGCSFAVVGGHDFLHAHLSHLDPMLFCHADGSVAWSTTIDSSIKYNETVTFNPFVQHQRPALKISGGNVFVGFGSHCDTNVSLAVHYR